MRKRIAWTLVIAALFTMTACMNHQKAADRITVGHAAAARMEKNGDDRVWEITGEIDSLDSFDGLDLQIPKDEVPLLGEWIYRITFDPSELVKGGTEIVIQFGESCLSINDRIYVAADGVAYEDILAWMENKYAYFSES